ncbi:hypothetical protein F3I16_19805 [Pseudomonas sp. L-22-4S-12]|uniref:hypothetical protein n=1 Tax=Pseudomonas sp. L-22-4S-12 TaxID=2610893 RepID=UPI001327CD0B|nr:hypothetical protein [Pseudomonas sp. L-22-4S-12]MWV18289.1 hypothetical protein [Pseudomonas sp. L-22-4S-12]
MLLLISASASCSDAKEPLTPLPITIPESGFNSSILLSPQEDQCNKENNCNLLLNIGTEKLPDNITGLKVSITPQQSLEAEGKISSEGEYYKDHDGMINVIIELNKTTPSKKLNISITPITDKTAPDNTDNTDNITLDTLKLRAVQQ